MTRILAKRLCTLMETPTMHEANPTTGSRSMGARSIWGRGKAIFSLATTKARHCLIYSVCSVCLVLFSFPYIETIRDGDICHEGLE